jgi:hypothetical protein
MYGSEKYMLHNIKDKCSHYLQASVDEERVCVVLQTAHDFHLRSSDSMTNLRQSGDKLRKLFDSRQGSPMLRMNLRAFVLRSPRWKSCAVCRTTQTRSSSTLAWRLVIESDDLKCKEEIIYQKIIEWSTNRCQDQNLTVTDENIRQVLGDWVYLVRFPIMERKYFTEIVSKKVYWLWTK